MTILLAVEGGTKLSIRGLFPERNLVRPAPGDGPELEEGSRVELWDSFEQFRNEGD